VAFTLRVMRNGRLVAALEEQRNTRGEAHLVVVDPDPDPDLTARESDELRADTVHKWMYPSTHRSVVVPLTASSTRRTHRDESRSVAPFRRA
jgi:hypothetical protein